MISQHTKELYEVYMYVFDSFATGKSEIASHLHLTLSSTLSKLKRLERDRLIIREDVNGESQGRFRRGEFKELCWQAWQTHDYISRQEAQCIFYETYCDGPDDILALGGEV